MRLLPIPRESYFEQRVKPFLLVNGPLLITISVFLVGYLIAGLMYPTMQKPQVFFNLFINNASLLIISIGMTFVVLSKGIDLSVASVLALTSVASAVLLKNGMSPLLVIPLMLLMGIAFGFVMGAINHYLKVESFIVTLMGSLLCARDWALLSATCRLPSMINSTVSWRSPQSLFHFSITAYVYIYSLVAILLLIVAIYIASSPALVERSMRSATTNNLHC